MKNHAKRILVVDDNHPSALTLSWAMEGNGHDVRTCYTGYDAIEMARTFHPEIVLLDVGMPGMNGLEACRAMRRQPHMDEAVIIAQTAWGDADTREQTLDAGFDFHMVKPIDLDEVERLVASNHPLAGQAAQKI